MFVLLITLLLLLLHFVLPSACVPVNTNVTLTNSTNLELLNDGNTVCFTPAPRTQILAFFLTNYIARIATFKKTSGYEGFRDYGKTLVALFVPFLGITEAAHTIARGSRFLGKDELGRALYAQALCVIVRGGGWRPEDGEIVRGCRLEGGSERRRRRQRKSRESRRSSRKHRRRRSGESYDSVDRLSRVHSSDADSDSDSEECVIDSTLLVDRIRQVEPLIEPSKWKIHGYYSLPESYAVATLTPAAVIQPLSTSNAESGQITLSNSYGVVKSFAAVVQIVSSVYSLYSAYGSQVNRFGYAAFAFSVLPYTIMSTLNAVANLIEADYDSLFLVRSDVMAEAEKREGGEFIGEVAELKPVSSEVERCEASDRVDLKFHRDPRTGDWKAYEVDEAGLRKSPRTYLLYIPTLETYSRRLDDRPKLYIPAVGRLYEADVMLDRKARKFHGRAVSVIITISLMIPYIVIGVISKFRVQSSTVQQRVLMMGWLIVGQIIGIMELASGKGGKHQWWIYLERAVVTFIVILGFAFAVGGFVVSARMFRDFGYCLRL